VKITRQMIDALLGHLNVEGPNWIDEAQDRRDDAVDAAREILKGAGMVDDASEEWEAALEELAGSVTFSPAHFEIRDPGR
jgi:hypothetical protein